MREAHLLGAEFRIVGADVEIDGELPTSLRDALPRRLLRQYLGAARADKEAIAFLQQLGVEAGAGRRSSPAPTPRWPS